MMDFTHPHFAEPRWLWLAVLAPLLLIALNRYAAWARDRQLVKIASPHFIADLTRSHSPFRRALKNSLLVLGVAGMGIALARPQWGEQEMEEEQLTGEDVVFVLDCSRSMLAADISPNRLDRARLAILDYVSRNHGGRVGLVAFAGQAFLQCPLTFDYDAFDEALRAINESSIAVAGTDVGRALEEASRAMEKNSRRKLLVLLTDGEDLERSGVRVAESLGKQGVVVFTIGVGTPAGAEIQTLNPQGQAELVRDNQGLMVRSQLDEKTLTDIAQATRGAYYPLGPAGEGLAKIRLAMETFNARAGAAHANKLGVDRFYIPIAAVLFLLVVEPLLSTRRSRQQKDIE